MESWLLAVARRRLDRLGGVWRDPKDVGIYRCKATSSWLEAQGKTSEPP